MKACGPAISVVIPAYKAEAFIARAIGSVLAQPDVRPQIVVVVDGVFDRTAEIAGQFPGVTVLVNEQNQGAPAARNRGLAAASAPYVLFLDADDYVEGPLLCSLLETARTDRLDIAFGPAMLELPDHTREGMRPPRSHAGLDLVREWLLGRFVPCNAVLWSTDFVRRIGGWREHLARNQDAELMFRAVLSAARVGYVDGGLAIYVQHDGPRVTLQRTAQSLHSALEVHAWIHAELSSRGELTEPTRRALCTHAYGSMCISYLKGFDALAEEFAAEWRNLGGTRHEGTLLHRLACGIIGVRSKQRLSASWLGRGLRTVLAISRRSPAPNPNQESLLQPMPAERFSAAGLSDAG